MVKSDRNLALGLVLLQFVLMVGAAALSDGVHHADDLTHFLIARSAWASPANFFDGWARPGCTTPLALVAALGSVDTGWLLARILNGAMAAACAWLAFRAAALMKVERPWTAALFTAVQPLFFMLGYTTLTEIPCALYLALALVFSLRGRVLAAAAMLSLTFVTRHECVALGGVWLLWWAAERARGRLSSGRIVLALAITLWAPVTVNAFGYYFTGLIPFKVFLEVKPSGGDYYGSGHPTTMILNWAVAAGPLLVLLVPFGLVALRRRIGWGLVAGTFLVYLGLHSLFFTFNLFASGGYPRFMTVVAVPAAILAARGLGRLRETGSGREAWVGWMLIGIWVVIAAIMDLELGRRYCAGPDASKGWLVGRWGVRILVASSLLVLAVRRLRGPMTRLPLGGLAAGFLVLMHVLHFCVFARIPLKRLERHRQLVAMAHWVADEYPERTVVAASEWAVYGLDLPIRVNLEYPWHRIDSAPAGTLYICDVVPGDWRMGKGARPVAHYVKSPAFRTLRFLEGAGGGIGIFEKRLPGSLRGPL